ncbi:MAG: LuxR C-terminal-related transcriptional regulator, partial [Syntrophomonas sp.]|nr:LuxR C-terminal-related transcriptional regulator [Syntrophomonas sp.]
LELQMLKSLCILDNFTPQQAVYVTGEQGAERIIRKISYENSFIRYDKQEDVYGIHNVFKSYLKKTLDEAQSGIEAKKLYRLSGEWCIRQEDLLTGLKQLIKASEYDLVMKAFEKSESITQIMDSSSKYVVEIFEQIPDEVKYRHPIGYLAYAGFYATNMDREAGSQLLSDVESYYQRQRGISSDMQRRINGEVELIKAYIGFNDAPLMREKLKRAHGLLGGQSYIANEGKIITFGSPHSLYLYYRREGALLETKECVQEMFQYYTEMAGGCGKGFDDILQAEYFLETGDLDKTELYAHKAAYKAKTMNQLSVLICAVFTITRALAAQGRFEEALETINDLNVEVEGISSPILNSTFDVCLGYMGGITGNENSFRQWLSAGDMEQSEILYQGMGFNYIVYGKHLLFKKEYIKLDVACEQMRQVFSVFSNMIGYLHMYILSAIACRHLYGMEEAKRSLLSAVKIGRADQIILPFAEYGIYILDILKDLQKANEQDEYLNLLLSSTSQYADNLKNLTERKAKALVLTKREKEILGLIIEGKSNREIATELFIAEVTVRKNITAIYQKLDVSGRATAVKKTLEMKIL